MRTATAHLVILSLGLVAGCGGGSTGSPGRICERDGEQVGGVGGTHGISADHGAIPPNGSGGSSFACADKTGDELAICMRVGAWTNGGTRLAILAPPEQLAPQAQLADWIKYTAPCIHPRIPATPEDGSGATIFVTVGMPPAFSGDAIKLAFDNQIYYPQTGPMAPLKGYVHLHVSSVSDLSAALGDGEDMGAQMQVPSAQTEPLLHDLAVAASQVMDGVAQPCTSDSRVLQDSSQLAHHRQAFVVDRCVNGVTQNRELQISSPDHQIAEAKLVFDLGGRPSLAYIPTVVRERGSLLTRVRVFGVRDGAFENLGTSSFVLLEDARVLDDVTSGASKELDGEALAILSFETGYSIRTPESYPWMLLGQYACPSPTRGRSLLGWYSAETDGNLEFARGFIPSYQDSPFASRGSDDHACAVNGLLADPTLDRTTWLERNEGTFSPTRVIPLGSSIFSQMTKDAVSHAMSLYGERARVGSMSATFPMDKDTCSASMQPLRSTKLLLAVAAGNASRDVVSTELCPQRLSPSPDIVVVGAAANGRMAAYSNFGRKSVDIAADGDAPGASDFGTSFAAPRVAYAAAQLAREVRGANNAQIRMALLLSADLPPDGPALPVRCGGSLTSDFNKARVALINLVNRFGDETKLMEGCVSRSVATAVAKAVEGNPAGSAVSKTVQRRIDILRDNEAICADGAY